MLVEGTIRWQVTEDCPWDVLLALALRDLAGLTGECAETIPPVHPAPVPTMGRRRPTESGRQSSEPLNGGDGAGSELEAGSRPGADLDGGSRPGADLDGIDRVALAAQWRGWWAGIILRETRPFMSPVRPPNFEVFDRALELQELLYRHYDAAMRWSIDRHAEYERSVRQRGSSLPAIYRLVQRRQLQLRRQSNSFRVDLTVLPLAQYGGWVVAPDTIVVSASLRDDPDAFQAWFEPIVEALV
jgi:hypothetical protein